MSRAGKYPVAIPDKVQVAVANQAISIKGPKGELNMRLTGDVNVTVDAGKVLVQPVNQTKRARMMWGTTRSNINNMVKGVSQGFTRRLEIRGVGYRAAVNKDVLTITLGFSHEVKYVIPQGVKIEVDKQTVLIISGHDKQHVGQVAAELRALRKPEPYKGKGVRFEDEYVRIKEGKKK